MEPCIGLQDMLLLRMKTPLLITNLRRMPNVEDITHTINQKYPKQPAYPHIISDELSPFARIVAPKESQIKTVHVNAQTQMLGAQAI